MLPATLRCVRMFSGKYDTGGGMLHFPSVDMARQRGGEEHTRDRTQ